MTVDLSLHALGDRWGGTLCIAPGAWRTVRKLQPPASAAAGVFDLPPDSRSGARSL